MITMLIPGCANRQSPSEIDWNHLNYQQIACGNDKVSPGCKAEDEDADVGKRGRGKGK